MKYLDSHSHIQEKEFDHNRADVLDRMREVGVGTIVVGCDYASSVRAVELAQREENIWACIGMHPVDTQGIFLKEDFTGLSGAQKQDGSRAVVALGECGLDYFRLEGDEVEVQKEKNRQAKSFRNQIEYALECDLSLMLHVRPSKNSTDAHDDALILLGEYVGLRGTSHFFTSTAEVAQRYIDLGFHISFPGVITFAPELADVVRAVPLERIVLETDSPYASPVPFRGQQNEPVRVAEIAQKIADIRAISLDEVARQTTHNACRLFELWE
jgi:TatD DNase family protein